ncbi:hypothetical protein F7725_006833 [Dissostichus mawsoni]|uniref:Uncharacterized protein n=1 Tax=Dissostichus mawsoni TaxID=36200 RepID=A0A7J5XVN8_DISMA|nr:hypothetical protein F7725_006833 [Dissostichus mawsoni]
MLGSGSCTSIINLRFQEGSEGSPSNPAKFKNQDFAQLKDNHLRRGGSLWTAPSHLTAALWETCRSSAVGRKPK